MSGGVDSSTALCKILDQGYNAIGVTMKLWEFQESGGNIRRETSCCSIDSINNAKLVCEQYDVPHYTFDHRLAFRKTVVDNFVDEYAGGRTPNPCVRCNIFLKWGTLLEQAQSLGADLIATGHYARVEHENGRTIMRKGIDSRKDQTYFLWGIDRSTLRKTIFPLGDLTKTEVRAVAAEAHLPNAFEPESQEICFIPDNDYRRFINEYAPEKLPRQARGNFVAANGDILGTHNGIANYTIGQRRGLGIAGPEPYYVQSINTVSGDITLSTRADMHFSGCHVDSINMLVNDQLSNYNDITVQIRYNHTGVGAQIEQTDPNKLLIEFQEAQFAVSPGQSAVFYSNDIVLGGGIITEGIR